MSLTITTQIDEKRVMDLLTGHRGSASDWLHSVTLHNLNDGAHVHFDREEDAEGAGTGRRHITDFATGLSLMAAGNPYQWSQFMQENDDDITFDVAWQFIVFGKEVYG